MAPANCGKHLIPFAFNIRPVGVQHRLQSRFAQHLLAGCHVRGQENADADWDKAQINNHVHGCYTSATFRRVFSLHSSPEALNMAEPTAGTRVPARLAGMPHFLEADLARSI